MVADTPVRKRGRPPRTDEQRAAQRGRLIDGAMDAVRGNGPDVSIDDMAAAAGVSKPVLYSEFGDKLGVGDAIAVVLAERLEQTVRDRLSAGGAFDLSSIVTGVVEGLVDLIDDEPELYAFVVRSIRTSDRGFLDNALVRVVHERARAVVGVLAPGMPAEHLAVLTDGLFGFVFAAVESWQSTKRPSKEQLVAALSLVIGEGFRAVAIPYST